MNPTENLFNRSFTEPSFAADFSARFILWQMCNRTFAGYHRTHRTAPVGAPLDQVARSFALVIRSAARAVVRDEERNKRI